MSMVDLSTLVPESFSPHTVETFFVTPPGGPRLALSLLQVRTAKHKTPRCFRPPFSVEFTPPPGPAFPQGLYLVEHEAMGTMELLIAPVQANEGFVYEAVFG